MRIQRNALTGFLLLALAVLIAAKANVSWSVGSIFEHFWPTLFVIPVGVFFHWLYFFLHQKGVGLLVPGGVVLTVGVVCQIAALFGSWEYMWPGFIFAPAAGLLELYLFGGRNRWLLIPINILTAISVLFFAVFGIGAFLSGLSNLKHLLALAVAAAGIGFLFLRKRKDPYASTHPWE